MSVHGSWTVSGRAWPNIAWLNIAAVALACLALPAAAMEVVNPSTGLCLDSWGKEGASRMHDCHGQRGNQDWAYDAQTGELRNPSSGLCLDSFGKAGPAQLFTCHGQQGNQRWEFNATTGELRNPSSGLCLDSWGKAGEAQIGGCHGQQGNQRFEFRDVAAISRQSRSRADLCPPASGNHCYAAGKLVLLPGDQVSAAKVRFVMQDDGNLVAYDEMGTPRWASNTNGNFAAAASFQPDGNLVVANDTVLFASNTEGRGDTLVIQSDGNVVIYDSDHQPIWATNSNH